MQRQPNLPVLVGCPRSGTTLLRVMVDAHPEIAVAGDAPRLLELVRSDRLTKGMAPDQLVAAVAARVGRNQAPPQVDKSQPLTFPDALRVVLAAHAAKAGKSRYGIKTPSFALHIPRLASLFPEARFVHIIRDGRDVAASMLSHAPFTDDPVAAGVQWQRSVLRARTAGSALGARRYLEVRYEELVAAPEVALRQITAFLDLSFEPDMLAYMDAVRLREVPPHLAALHERLQLPPTPQLRDWRSELTPAQVAAFEQVAGATLVSLGYQRSGAALRPRARAAASARAMAMRARDEAVRRRRS